MTANAKTILIDGYNLGLEKGTGVATYARNLSYEIGNLGHDVSVLYGNGSSSSRDKLLREISFFDAYQDEHKGVVDVLQRFAYGARGPKRHKAVDIPMSGKVVTKAFTSKLPHHDKIYNAPDLFRRSQSAFHAWGGMSTVEVPEKPDLVHWTYPLALRVARRPNIYTLHDIVPLRLPYTTLDHKRAYLKLIRKLDRTGDHFVTVSECSKRDLVEIVGISPDRITNTYQSVDIPAHLMNKSEEQVAREVEGFAEVGYKGYVLFWGSIEPKKNIGRMIEAYLASKVDVPLVIVGAQAWKSKKELQLLNEGTSGVLDAKGQGGRKGIVRLPYAPFSVLVSLIRGAQAAIFPSLYEGFGLPALEAMLLGTPVLCSNTASLPEVAGEAALMVDPYDSVAIADGIRTILGDADLREELSTRGRVQAQRFSPAAYRERLADVYQRFL